VKIIPKLTLALVGGTCIILTVNGYLRVRRERTYFEEDRFRDHAMIGRSVGATAAAVWKSDGEQAAILAIDEVSSRFTTIHIRWIAGARGSTTTDQAPIAIATGEPVTSVVQDRGAVLWKTTVALDVDGLRRGTIELTEPAISEQRFVRSTIQDTVTTAVALAIVSAILSFAMSQWLVGAPVRALSEKARQVGRGSFSRPVLLRQHDELGDLAVEMNAMAEALEATMNQLRHADRLAIVGTLASGVAHELGTPLNVVSARAGMIASGETGADESKDYARVIVGAADRMTKTIRRLLQFARREGLRREIQDLAELVKDSLELMRPLANKRSIRLELLPNDTDARASIDAGQIQQVITNLVMNAIQAMPRGGTVEAGLSRRHVQPPVDVGGPETECLCLRVTDQGEGIAPEHLPHIFEPFFTTKDVGEGTGLGLAVTYGIVREHGGWITVESSLHQGTSFSVFLPIASAS
jgi:two-component system NtrC family sensor kinase